MKVTRRPLPDDHPLNKGWVVTKFLGTKPSGKFKKKSPIQKEEPKQEIPKKKNPLMNFLAALFPSKEFKAVLGVYNEAKFRFKDSEAFKLVEADIKKWISSHPIKITSLVSEGAPPRQVVYALIANIAAYRVESGNYHIYRGVLNPMLHGGKLLKLFDEATDELMKIGSWTEEQAKREKKAIRDNIKEVG